MCVCVFCASVCAMIYVVVNLLFLPVTQFSAISFVTGGGSRPAARSRGGGARRGRDATPGRRQRENPFVWQPYPDEDTYDPHWLPAQKKKRGILMSYALHFNHNRRRVPAGQDPFFKVRKLLDIVDPLYLDAFCPGKELSLDESMIKFKGTIYFGQFHPAKSNSLRCAKPSLGTHALGFFTYTGKDRLPNVNPAFSITENIVRELVTGYPM